MEATLTAALVGLAIGLVEVIKSLISKFKNGNSKNGAQKSVLTDKERIMLKSLYDWHDKEDPDGVKVWYVRQSLADAITVFSQSVEKQTRTLEAISNRLENLGKQVDRIDSNINSN